MDLETKFGRFKILLKGYAIYHAENMCKIDDSSFSITGNSKYLHNTPQNNQYKTNKKLTVSRLKSRWLVCISASLCLASTTKNKLYIKVHANLNLGRTKHGPRSMDHPGLWTWCLDHLMDLVHRPPSGTGPWITRSTWCTDHPVYLIKKITPWAWPWTT